MIGGWLSLKSLMVKVMFGKANVGSLAERKPIIATTVLITLKVNLTYCAYGVELR